jgi:hypothetical protein
MEEESRSAKQYSRLDASRFQANSGYRNGQVRELNIERDGTEKMIINRDLPSTGMTSSRLTENG